MKKTWQIPVSITMNSNELSAHVKVAARSGDFGCNVLMR